MKYYFKRTTDNITLLKLYSYTSLTVGIVSLVFLFLGDTARIQNIARWLTGISFGFCAVLSAIDVIQEGKKQNTCNLYDLARALVSGIFCILSVFCIDFLLS